ncbi:hypothetical protein CCZ01_00405 [Helicobacter monodelphidis]|uniref:glycosyltransferase family 2 protein n=1 Tax=Helicobacter sp. 15-1451 TaxID=2004995 RepID=UPI000DCB273B|nr:glycosyltransferase family 2 protein [Helicobacter sp. 15-1451]RAX59241.1 hypothetical protein CCZ01_00405 [Helicobacter sp. 15-1451]
MENVPDISIVIPAYNAERFIANTLESCLQQSLQNIEIIVVDDCGVDKTREIVQQYARSDSRIRILNNSQNLGTLATRIKGIQVALAEGVVFLDADDKLEKNACERFLEEARRTGVDIVYGNRITYEPNGQKITKTFAHLPHGSILEGEQIFYEVFNPKTWAGIRWTQQTKWFKTSILLQAINFMEEALGKIPHGLSVFEDAFFTACILPFARKALNIEDILYFYTYNIESSSKNKSNEQVKKGFQNFFLIITYLEQIATQPLITNNLILNVYYQQFLRKVKYEFYSDQRHLEEIIYLLKPSSRFISLLPPYLQAMAYCFPYSSKKLRILLRIFFYVVSFGRIQK